MMRPNEALQATAKTRAAPEPAVVRPSQEDRDRYGFVLGTMK